MSYNTGTKKRESGYASHPGYQVELTPCSKRVRVVFNGETIADTTSVVLLHETRHIPVYYFPRADVADGFLRRTDHQTFCPFKGEASYWTIEAGDRRAENAVWSYEDPFAEVPGLKDYMAFYWNRVDAWFEEDEEVFVHARDPRVRIDILNSARPVRVVLGGETVAETTAGRFLFETGLPTRYYLPMADVAERYLTPSATESACPYKGKAHYWSACVGDQVYEDIAWSYPDPVAECAAIRDYVCFFNERVDAITVSGVEVPDMKTKWSPK